MTTLAKVKAYLGITATTHDAVISELVVNVTAWIETYLNRSISATEDFEELFDGGDDLLMLSKYPLIEAPEIAYNAGTQASPIWTPIDPEMYEYNAKTGIIRLFAKSPNGLDRVRVTYTGGYEEIPSDIELIAKQLVARMFSQRKAQGKTHEGLGSASIDWTTQITQEQLEVLNKYKNVTV